MDETTSVLTTSATAVVEATTTSRSESLVASTPEDNGCAHVIGATVSPEGGGTFTFAATILSADTGWDKYADLWTVAADGSVLGERVLAHPHETEQPFTRSLSSVSVPESVRVIVIAARDSVEGFCGETFELEMP